MLPIPPIPAIRLILNSAQYTVIKYCGMAGLFGFEPKKYDLSRTIAERGILPAARKASAYTAILAYGCSRREQIEQLTGRPTLHLAEYLQRP
jgi:hypothetical protein